MQIGEPVIHDRKIYLEKIFRGDICPACDSKKQAGYWLCRTCRDNLHNSDIAKQVDTACDMHLAAVEKYIHIAGQIACGVVQ